MTKSEQKDILSYLVISVANLTTHQSILISLMKHKVPVDREQKRILDYSERNNSETMAHLEKILAYVKRAKTNGADDLLSQKV